MGLISPGFGAVGGASTRGVMSAADQIGTDEIKKEDDLDAATVDELVRYSRHAAARTLRLT